MLRIIQNRSADQAKRYFTQSDYYTEGQELAGYWGGKGAELLGLYGQIDQKSFDALCDNLNPETGDRLSPRTKYDRTVGYDFNFHVPKGISLAYMLNRDERILDAFRESVRETMHELEAEAKTRVRIGGRDEERVTGNLLWGEFIHMTARPVEGTPDPHLHAHCFVFNQTYDPIEKRWKAAQFRDLKRDAPYFEATFYARLGKRLTDLGYPLARRGKEWDLAGVPKTLSRKFSRRTEQVEKHAAEQGIRDATEKDQLGAKTRESKVKELSLPELRELWRERLTDDESNILVRVAEHDVSSGRAEVSPEAAMQHAIGHCFERDSVVPVRKLLAESLRYGIGDVTIEQVHEQLAVQHIIIREWAGREMATTPAVLAEEQAMLSYARQERGRHASLNPDWTIRRTWLNAGQQAAVKHVTDSRDRIMMIRGVAGTGKTSLMQEAVEAIKAGGRQVFTFAPSSEASRNVLRSEGFENATTVEELLVNPKLQEAAEGGVLWIDEAGLLGVRQLKKIFDIADQIDARVVISGDWKQHASVERGAAMRLLEKEGGLEPAIVSSIQRQSGAYREAVARLAKGETEQGFDLLDGLGWIREVDDESRPAEVAREYAATLAATGKSPLVVSPTHAEGERITAAIRTELKARRLLEEEERHVARLVPLNLTAADRADPAMIEEGDVIVFHQNAKGYRKGERIVVTGELPTSLLNQAERFQVYRLAELSVAAGDMIRFTANGTTKDGKHRLNNGAIHRVAGFTKAGDIRLENGWTVGRNHGFVAAGYVTTSHSAQGKTVDKVIVVESAESFAAASREQFYVSVSRGKREAIIFTDQKDGLKNAISRSDERLSATELVGAAKRSEAIERMMCRLPRLQARKRQAGIARQEEVAHERS